MLSDVVLYRVKTNIGTYLVNGSVIPKGVIIFSSKEEAEFVDFMMNMYFDPHDEWRYM